MRKSHSAWAAIVVTLIAFFVRAYLLGAQSLWWDEVFSVIVGKLPFPKWFNLILFQDRAQVPAYFFLMSLWTTLGISEYVVRYISAMAGTASVPLIYQVGSRIGGRRTGALCALLLALSPFHVWYSQEARVYALLAFLSLLSAFVFLRLLRAPNWRMAAVAAAVGTVGLYTHYLFALTLLAQMVFLILLRRRYRSPLNHWFAANVVSGTLFMPWLIAVLASGGFVQAGINWIPPAQWYDPILSIYSFILGATNDPRSVLNWVAVAAFCGLGMFGAVRGYRAARGRDDVIFLLLWLVLPVAFIFFVSVSLPLAQKRSIYVDRYMTPEVPALLILVAFGSLRLVKERPRLGGTVALVAAVPVLLSLGNVYGNNAYARDDWRGVQALLVSHADPRRDVVVLDASSTWPYGYYNKAGLPLIPVEQVPSVFLEQLEKHVATTRPARIWLLTTTIPPNAHRFLPTADEQMALAGTDPVERAIASRYKLESETLLQGILVSSYRVSP